MRKILLGAAAGLIISASAASSDDAVNLRKNGMQGIGLAMGTLGGMAKGQIPFDQKSALSALKLISYVASTYDQHFPEGSDLDAETTASPKIWEDMGGFKAAIEKFKADAQAAIDAAPATQEALGAVMGSVGGNCKACHQSYRVRK